MKLPAYDQTPNFFKGLTADNSPEMQALGGLLNPIRAMYQRYVFVPVTTSDVGGMAAGFDEYRIFPILKTVWAEKSLPPARMMTLVVGFTAAGNGTVSNTPDIQKFSAAKGAGLAPTFLGDDAFYTPDRLANMDSTLQALFPQVNFGQQQLIPGTDLHVRGVVQQQLDIWASIDPNELTVLKMCPLGNNRYRVDFRLEVCNKGYLAESNLPIELSDLTGKIQWLTFAPGATISSIDSSTAGNWKFIWNDTWGGIPNHYTNESDYEPQCHEIYFTVYTDYDGAWRLAKGEGLRACVTFPQAQGNKTECYNNLDIHPPLLLPGMGYNCSGGACWELILVLLILLGVILYDIFFWSKGKYPKEPC
ncbi:MAG: hypothetical protein IPL65_00800 [Lewinellaceae bacterium]|nr:hypothetical protein [Lewinellaceae bacterium]